MLLVESGSRGILHRLVPLLYERNGEIQIDLITCFPGVPNGFRGKVYRVADYSSSAARRRLFSELKAKNYLVTGVICSGEPLMTKWKWATAFRIPAKVLLINENADYLCLDWAHRRNMLQMAKTRAGLEGTAWLPALGRILGLPFALVYLLLFAGFVHFKRMMRST
jgi:hypothetical protein